VSTLLTSGLEWRSSLATHQLLRLDALLTCSAPHILPAVVATVVRVRICSSTAQSYLADLSHEQCRRDEMESLEYMMLYFLHRRLPWQVLKGESKEQTAQLIMEMKASISLDELCRDVPKEFKDYMSHVRGLDFATSQTTRNSVGHSAISFLDMDFRMTMSLTGQFYSRGKVLEHSTFARPRVKQRASALSADCGQWGRNDSSAPVVFQYPDRC